METIKGLVIHKGVVLGKATLWNPEEGQTPTFDLYINQKEVLFKALFRSTEELEATIAESNAMYSDIVSGIFEAHKLMANDPLLIEETIRLIEGGNNAYSAYQKATQKIIGQFQKMTNSYMRNRVVDIEDATDRVLAAIMNTEYEHALSFSEPRILILKKMKPSILYNCHQPAVVGFLAEEGNYDQHSALIARTKDLPGLIVPGALKFIHQDDKLLLDADNGMVYVSPSEEMIGRITERIR
jgi:phosphoenolpyruvate-protein kinase (PTS system EI component)